MWACVHLFQLKATGAREEASQGTIISVIIEFVPFYERPLVQGNKTEIHSSHDKYQQSKIKERT